MRKSYGAQEGYYGEWEVRLGNGRETTRQGVGYGDWEKVAGHEGTVNVEIAVGLWGDRGRISGQSGWFYGDGEEVTRRGRGLWELEDKERKENVTERWGGDYGIGRRSEGQGGSEVLAAMGRGFQGDAERMMGDGKGYVVRSRDYWQQQGAHRKMGALLEIKEGVNGTGR